MKKLLLSVLVLASAHQSLAAAEVLEGKTAEGAKCSVRMDLEKDLVSFAGDGVAFGFFVTSTAMNDALKKGGKMVTITGDDGPVKARVTLNFSETGALESANFSQKTFIKSKRVKCSDLK
jgi:enhancing lycopene biosynthesis protein 2